MSKPRPWLPQEIRLLESCLEKTRTIIDAHALFAQKYKRTYSSYKAKMNELGLAPKGQALLADPNEAKKYLEERIKIKKIEQERDEYKSLYQEAIKRDMGLDAIRSLLYDIKKYELKAQPKWCYEPKSVGTHGTPMLHISDIHYGERVFKNQVNGRNEYDTVIANKRLDHTFETATNILMNSFSKPKYDGIILPLNGDLLSGNIHQELRDTNCEPIAKSVAGLAANLIRNITALQKVFKKVYVPCQVGNHGRFDKKPRMKDGVYDNYEWIVFTMLSQHFSGCPDVIIQVPESFETTFQVYNRRFLQVHGDAFMGGNGIAGIIMPIVRGQHKKLKGYAALNQSFDVMIIGHFHQYHFLPSLVINGSVKGYDEYAFKSSFPFERPIQSLHIEHPQMGPIFSTPIYCDSYPGGYLAGK